MACKCILCTYNMGCQSNRHCNLILQCPTPGTVNSKMPNLSMSASLIMGCRIRKFLSTKKKQKGVTFENKYFSRGFNFQWTCISYSHETELDPISFRLCKQLLFHAYAYFETNEINSALRGALKVFYQWMNFARFFSSDLKTLIRNFCSANRRQITLKIRAATFSETIKIIKFTKLIFSPPPPPF
jgi:hypothetical protein